MVPDENNENIGVSISTPRRMGTRTITPIRDNALHRPVRIRRARRFYGDSQEVEVSCRNRIVNPRLIRNLNVPNIEPAIIHNDPIVHPIINVNVPQIAHVDFNVNNVDVPDDINHVIMPMNDVNDNILDEVNIAVDDDIHVVDNVDPMFNEVIQLGLNLTEESTNLKNDLNLAASGVEPVISLCNQPVMRSTMNTFIDGIFKSVLKHCNVCHENWFNEVSDIEVHNDCNRCNKEKKECAKNDIQFVGSMSSNNNMDPFFHLDNLAITELADLNKYHSLNSQEQALIAISTPIMSVFKLKGPRDGQNIGFKGNVINIAQDISKICKILPRLPNNSNFFTVRSIRGSDPGQYKDFKVRRERIHKWLLFLKNGIQLIGVLI